MTNLPRITVILAVRNMQRYVGDAIASVVAQNYPNTELIVMDGGSTDNTVSIIKQFLPFITYWQSKPDNGPANAANIAIDMATGDFIGFLNADDTLEAGLFSKIAETYTNHPDAKIISCGINIVKMNDRGERKLYKTFADAEKLQLTVPNLLNELTAFNGRYYHKDIFSRYGKFQPFDANGKWNLSNDREFLLRLAMHNVNSILIAEPLYTYLSHTESFSFSFKNLPRIFHEHIALGQKLLQQSITPMNAKLIEKWIETESANLFLISLISLNVRSAIYAVSTGMQRNPFAWLKRLFERTYTISAKKFAGLLFR